MGNTGLATFTLIRLLSTATHCCMMYWFNEHNSVTRSRVFNFIVTLTLESNSLIVICPRSGDQGKMAVIKISYVDSLHQVLHQELTSYIQSMRPI